MHLENLNKQILSELLNLFNDKFVDGIFQHMW